MSEPRRHREELKPGESLTQLRQRMLRHFQRFDDITDQHGKVVGTMRTPRWRILGMPVFYREGHIVGIDVKFRTI